MSGARVTRRALLGAAAAGTAAIAVGRATRTEATTGMTRDTDVAIIGAGLAGLSAARKLTQAGVDCVVLEARDRVGGRTLNADLGGGKVVEMGGQWVGPLSGKYRQSHVLALARSVGVGTFPTYGTGQSIDYRGGMRFTYSGQVPLDTPAGDVEVEKAVVLLDQLAKQVPVESPWTASNADLWDGQSMDTWIRANIRSSDGRALMGLIVESVYSATPAEVSLLDFLFAIQTTGTLENQYTTVGGAQDSRFIGGSQLISLRVAAQLGDRVVLDTPVRRINQDARGVDIASDRVNVHAREVIVTAPPPLAARIEYDPPLPGMRDDLTQMMPLGAVIKCNVVYPRPFWRDAGLSGYATSDVPPAMTVFDNSPPDGRPGVLVTFLEANHARQWSRRTAVERRRAVLDCLGLYFGSAAASPAAFLEKSWIDDPWGRCGYGGYFPPGGWSAVGPALLEPVGRVHWAGSETSTVWNGYMDGAVYSGERAAAEVMAAMGGTKPPATPAPGASLPATRR